MKIRVYGKINLSLNVLTKEIDGYHQLDMVNQSVSVFDEIELAPRVDKLCRVRCDKDIGVINTALTSASAFVKRFGTNGYDIFIKKGIPMKGGLGGSSADAAGILAALSKIHGVDAVSAGEIADAVGSDVKYMMEGGLARVRGTGGDVEKIDSGAVNYFVLIVPPFGMSTQRVFAAFDEKPDFGWADNDRLIDAVINEDVAAMKMNMRNGLQSTAFRLDKRLGDLYDAVRGRCFVQMTGSGSCLFAVADGAADAAYTAERLKKEGIRAVAVESRGYGIEFL